MYFKKLELVGFKSFLDKTTLHFEPGVTAVVGPNGCGKSNVFDSIRWVLGEQSAKSLRGSDMQDVIFNGTDTQEAVGMAEVTLTFDNSQKFFNFDHHEVAITRRLFRSGESEYLLNKTPVRLKDIMDILLGTGIGAESYSIVAQGKIDLVLSSRPEERRMIFDEASGITKYKTQKRETLRRLEETEQNLLRVNDIVTEVKRQIASLERQAAKARRYKESFEELKLKEISLGLLQKQDLLTQKNTLINQLGELESQEAALLEALREQESKISSRQSELKTLEENIMGIKNQLLTLESVSLRNAERATFNKERIIELGKDKVYLEEQAIQVKAKLAQDEEKLNQVRNEYDSIRQNIEAKSGILQAKEEEINLLEAGIKLSLEKIAQAKKEVMALAAKTATAKNELADFSSKQQIYLARKKRLDIEKAKINEEKVISQDSLNKATQEVGELKAKLSGIGLEISGVKNTGEQEALLLNECNAQIEKLERQKLGLESHKEFLEKLKSEYEEIGEAMNAVIYLDKIPAEKVSGLVVKIKDYLNLNAEESGGFKVSGEAKPIELDTAKILEKLARIEEELGGMRLKKASQEARIVEVQKNMQALEQALRTQEISLANKETARLSTLEQFNRIREEEDIILLELADVNKELTVLEDNLAVKGQEVTRLNNEERMNQDAILREEERISLSSKTREGLLVAITQVKTELESLNKRILSDENTLRILEGSFAQDKEALEVLERQKASNLNKKQALELEIVEYQKQIAEIKEQSESQKALLSAMESQYKEISEGTSDVVKKIEADRKEIDELKNKLYELQMLNKDIDYKYAGIRERLLQAYKADIEGVNEYPQGLQMNSISEEITRLKDKVDSYGAVNLVAIEEYDELKKRYDFLIQQQTDLTSAKDSLHQAILKINRTTKEMFLETFERVKVEFRNYFRLLFNGGDAQLFLIDEQDPLESGIEIICRPPGKKLQNVLLLSGGEKSMSAIALIFAIFKVKPAPFCILDEIDAALDEANVDRFGRMLQEFTHQSQFIVVTHNKRTIANADVMYGITMEESGVSKIVSVKFSKDEAKKDKEPDGAVAEPV